MQERKKYLLKDLFLNLVKFTAAETDQPWYKKGRELLEVREDERRVLCFLESVKVLYASSWVLKSKELLHEFFCVCAFCLLLFIYFCFCFSLLLQHISSILNYNSSWHPWHPCLIHTLGGIYQHKVFLPCWSAVEVQLILCFQDLVF